MFIGLRQLRRLSKSGRLKTGTTRQVQGIEGIFKSQRIEKYWGVRRTPIERQEVGLYSRVQHGALVERNTLRGRGG